VVYHIGIMGIFVTMRDVLIHRIRETEAYFFELNFLCSNLIKSSAIKIFSHLFIKL